MEEIEQLLEKYWTGSATPAELQRLISLLTENEADVSAILEKDFVESVERRNRLPVDPLSESTLQKINQQIDQLELADEPDKKVIRPYFRTIGWAAAAIAGVIICFRLLNLNFPGGAGTSIGKVESIPAIKTKIIRQTRQVVNTTEQPENIRLEDGSIVVIYPKCQLTYKEPFDSLRREISMQGKAFFKVTGDIKRPFTVTAANTATTVLGTEFLVNTQSEGKKTSVRLLKGKVAVRLIRTPGQIAYLKPGEEFTVDDVYNKIEIRPFGDKQKNEIHNSGRPPEVINTLTFSKTPLPKVFQTIERIYHVRIRYEGKTINKLVFTGEFFPSDTLETVISGLCTINELTFQKKDNTIIITSK